MSSFDFNSQPIIVATIGAAEGADPVEAAAIARGEVVPDLLAIEGVSSAELTGGATPILDIVLDPEAMAEHGISLQQVQGILMANQITLPSGAIDEGDLRLPVSTEHRFTSVEELESQIVGASAPAGGMPAGMSGSAAAATSPAPDASPAPEATAVPGTSTAPEASAAPGTPTDGGEASSGLGLQLPDLSDLGQALAAIPMPVRLGDIATIEEREVNASGYARTNGQPSLTVSVLKRSGANTIDVADEVEAVFAETEALHGDVVDVAIIQDQSQFIRDSQTGLVQEGLLGALFAVLVIYVFLRSARTTLVAAISIPLSIIDRPGRLFRGGALHQHPDPGRPGRRRRTRRGRLHRRAREHLPSPRPGRFGA